MDESWFDRLTRALGKPSHRRGFLGFVAVVAAFLGQRVVTGTQLGPATCGSQGDVCTLLLGCCSGFTCVTSSTNSSYGICVTGSGGMMPASTSLISPHSETLDQDVVSLQAAVAAVEADTSATDLQAERDARIAELKARKDARRSKRQTRLDTKRTNQQTRKDDQQARRRAAASTPTPTPTRSSSAQTQIVTAAVSCPQGVGASQVVTITNRTTRDVDVTQLTSMIVNPAGDEPFLSLGTIAAGTTLQIYFGSAPIGFSPHATEPIFDNSPLEGVRVTLGTGAVLTACCDGTRVCVGETATQSEPTPTPTPVPARRKRDKNKGKDKRKQKQR